MCGLKGMPEASSGRAVEGFGYRGFQFGGLQIFGNEVAVRIDQVIRGEPAQGVRLHRLALFIIAEVTLRPGEVVLFDESGGVLHGLVQCDAQDHEIGIGRVSVGDVLEIRQVGLDPAGLRGPEAEQEEFAAVIGQADGLIIEGIGFEGRGGLTDRPTRRAPGP